MMKFLKGPGGIILLVVVAYLLYSWYYQSRVVTTAPHPTTVTPVIPNSPGQMRDAADD